MNDANRVLAMDIGTGTQDILLYDSSEEPENCLHLVVPSPTRLVAQRIARITAARRPLVLGGVTMGGGPLTRAVARHVEQGLKVYATPPAALSLDDDLEAVRATGVELVEDDTDAPAEAVGIRLGDVDLEALVTCLDPFEVSLPDKIAVAVFDHGFSPGESNRRSRFRRWRRFIEEDGRLGGLVYREVPQELTRMRAVQETVPGVVLMDTAVAAIWGGLLDHVVASFRQEGILSINLGNGHAVALLIQGDRILGVFEHHTRQIEGPRLFEFVEEFRRGTLTDQSVYGSGGHGCFIHPDYRDLPPFRFTSVTGPRRRLARGAGFHEAVPFGDMMMAGPFGLVAGSTGWLEGREDAEKISLSQHFL